MSCEMSEKCDDGPEDATEADSEQENGVSGPPHRALKSCGISGLRLRALMSCGMSEKGDEGHEDETAADSEQDNGSSGPRRRALMSCWSSGGDDHQRASFAASQRHNVPTVGFVDHGRRVFQLGHIFSMVG